jgi:glutaredoxin
MNMKSAAILLGAAAAISGTLFAAQLYRWVDEKGNVEFRDTPPPASAPAKKIEERKLGGTAAPAPALPYSVQQAMKNFPVTLWATDCGDACTNARAHLARRGVPYAEKDPQAEFDNFKKVTGGTEVPVIFVGSTRLKGYLENELDNALDAAGYPSTALVKPAAKPAAKPAEKSAAGESKPAAPAAPAAGGGVRLYTTPDCGSNCAGARQILAARGIAFQEIEVVSPAQIEQLKKMTGNDVVPVLHLGQFWVQGYNPADYEAALDKAGHKGPTPQ